MSWDALRDLVALHERTLSGEPTVGTSWVPAVDLHETTDRYILVAELPGVLSSDFQIAATATTLTVAGIRPSMTMDAVQYLRVERGQGRFSRTFSFPEVIDAEHISADLRDGILTVVIPKGGHDVVRHIDVD